MPVSQSVANKYRLGDIIYTSDLSWVYEATFALSSREARKIPLILKTIPRLRHEDSKLRALKTRIHSEAQALRSLDHPFIVKVIDEVEEATLPYLVMRRRTTNLSDYLQTKGRLKLLTAIPLLYNLATALDYAHTQGILHRDIKPDNILLDLDSTGEPLYPYITDFGIAQFQERGFRTETNHIMGTMAYMPPERWEGKETTRLSDIYSFGLVAYEMLAGFPLFKSGEAVQEQINSIMNPSPEFYQGVKAKLDPDVAVIILKAIARNPEDRYQTATEFVDSLGKLLTASHLEQVNQTIARNLAEAGRGDELALMLADRKNQKFPILWISVAALAFFIIGVIWAEFRPEENFTENLLKEPSATIEPVAVLNLATETSSASLESPAEILQASQEPSATYTDSPTITPSQTPRSSSTVGHTPSLTLSPTVTATPSISPSPRPEVNCEGAGWFYHRANRGDSLSHYSASLANHSVFAGMNYQERNAYITQVNTNLNFSRLTVGDLVCLPAAPPLYVINPTATVLSTGGLSEPVVNSGNPETNINSASASGSGTSNNNSGNSGNSGSTTGSGNGSGSGTSPTEAPPPPPTTIAVSVSVSASCGQGNSGATSFGISNNGAAAVNISWRLMEGGNQVASGSLSLNAGQSANAWSGNTKNKNYSLVVNETGASSGESCG